MIKISVDNELLTVSTPQIYEGSFNYLKLIASIGHEWAALKTVVVFSQELPNGKSVTKEIELKNSAISPEDFPYIVRGILKISVSGYANGEKVKNTNTVQLHIGNTIGYEDTWKLFYPEANG